MLGIQVLLECIQYYNNQRSYGMRTVSGCEMGDGLQERKKAAGSDDDYSFLLCVLGNSAHCTGVALTAVALVLSLHAFVLFKGQRDSFLYVVPNAALADLRLTIILAAVFLGWSVVYTIYCQTRLTDVAMIDWERPQQVRSPGDTTISSTIAHGRQCPWTVLLSMHDLFRSMQSRREVVMRILLHPYYTQKQMLRSSVE